MFVQDAMRIRDKRTGKEYDCFPQMVDLNFRNEYVLRYNIGINGHHEWSNICCVYSNDEFNSDYEVI